jgi:hypothetical protein
MLITTEGRQGSQLERSLPEAGTKTTNLCFARGTKKKWHGVPPIYPLFPRPSDHTTLEPLPPPSSSPPPSLHPIPDSHTARATHLKVDNTSRNPWDDPWEDVRCMIAERAIWRSPANGGAIGRTKGGGALDDGQNVSNSRLQH